MAKEYSHIDERLREFIGNQAVFFVATAPSEGGRVNLSPKGYRDTFAVLDEHTVAYLDLFGSARKQSPTCVTMAASPSCSARSPATRGSCDCSALDAPSALMMPNS
jgi:hypothetical protein